MAHDLTAPHIVARGNPVDGFTYYGPFADYFAASEFTESDDCRDDSDWWIVQLRTPTPA